MPPESEVISLPGRPARTPKPRFLSALAERALRAGASAYVHKQAPAEALTEAIGRILSGGVYLSPDMAQRLVTATQTGTKLGSSAIESLSDQIGRAHV